MNRASISTDIKSRIKLFENCDLIVKPEIDTFAVDSFARSDTDQQDDICRSRSMTMMMPTPPPPPPPGVQTDENGLILPKKLINPCLQSTDHKQLHRELKFTAKMGISVLNQRTELQKAYDKQREKQLQQQLAGREQQQQQQQQQHHHQQQQHSPTFGLKSELNRVIMERAQRNEHTRLQSESENDEERQYVNPEYLNVRAKLRAGQRTELN